jgi:peptidoglycan/LPS O-acetylase OafA/YrhL
MSRNLDILRAVAVLCVVLAHTANICFLDTRDWTWHLGQLGVIIFFVHTSLVLLQSLERQPADGGPLVAPFYVRRAFRIYPLAIVGVVLAFVAHRDPTISHLPHRMWSTRQFATNLALVQNLTYDDSMLGGLWTLPLEVQMYVVLPLLFRWGQRRSGWWALGLWTASVPVAVLQLQTVGRLNVLSYVPCFLGGVLAWRLIDRTLPRWNGRWWPLALAATTLIWLLGGREHEMYRRWIFCITLGAVIPLFHDLSENWLTICAKQIAQYSYGIYLSHVVILLLAMEMPRGWRLMTGVSALMVIPVLLYWGIEHPMIRVGQRLARRLQAPRAPATETFSAVPRTFRRR